MFKDRLVIAAFCVLIVCGCQRKPDEQIVELREISAFDVPKQINRDFTNGQGTQCTSKPDPNVTVYPQFISSKPLFGSIHLPCEYHNGFTGKWYYFALDASGGAGLTYNTLYFDLNGDLDLTNDMPIATQKNPLKKTFVNDSSIEKQICFDCIGIPMAFGDEGMRPLEVMPRLLDIDDNQKIMTFVTTKAFKGKVNIAGHKYDVWIGHNRRITGWFDNPSTALHLVPDGDFSRIDDRSFNWLKEFRKINGIDYCFSAAPSGKLLTVRPYSGAYGIIKARPVNQPGKSAKISGTLFSDRACFQFGGKRDFEGNRKPYSLCKVPIGDYSPVLDVYLDDLHVGICRNIHSDGHSWGRVDDAPPLVVGIREGEPFILDFSNKPEVLFMSPAKDTRIKLGQTLQVESVLIDPKLDLMVTDLEHVKLKFMSPDSDYTYFVLYGIAFCGAVSLIFWLLSLIKRSKRRMFLILSGLGAVFTVGTAIFFVVLNLERVGDDILPVVNIVRSDGEEVANGVMPFG